MSRSAPARLSHLFTAARRSPDASGPAGVPVVLHVLAGALLALAIVADAHAQPSIGRLFSTPEQRAELDRLRSDADLAAETVPVAAAAPRDVPLDPPTEPVKAPPVRTVSIEGIAIRADGHGVAWINGVETAAGTTTPDGVRVGALLASDGRVRIRIPGARRGVDLEPGQTIDVETGRVVDTWEPRWATGGVAATAAGEAGRNPDTAPNVGAAGSAGDDAPW